MKKYIYIQSALKECYNTDTKFRRLAQQKEEYTNKQEFRKLELAVRREIIIREKYIKTLFTLLNNSLFCGEYLLSGYIEVLGVYGKTEEPDKIKPNHVDIFPVTKNALDCLQHFVLSVTNKAEHGNRLFSYEIPKAKLTQLDELDDFTNISLQLAFIDHRLTNDSTKNFSELLVIRELIAKKAMTDADSTYKKLQSKCSFLIMKEMSSRKSLECHEYTMNGKKKELYLDKLLVEDTYCGDYTNKFKLLYSLSGTYKDCLQQYKNKLDSTTDFVILGQHYKKAINEEDLNELINCFNVFNIQREKEDLTIFDKYSLKTVNLFLQNCKLVVRLAKNKDNLAYCLKVIDDTKSEIKGKTIMLHYYMYCSILGFLSEQITKIETKLNTVTERETIFKEIKEINILFDLYLEKYKESIHFCSTRNYYPFQLMHKEYLEDKGKDNHTIFIASSFAEPVNYERLYSRLEEERIMSQKGKSIEQRISSRIGLQEVSASIESAQEKFDDSFKESQKKSFTYIGAFVALISFIIGSLRLFNDPNLGLGIALLNVTSLGVVLCLFISLINILTSDEKDRANRTWWLAGYILVCLIVILFLRFFLPSEGSTLAEPLPFSDDPTNIIHTLPQKEK